ncbi:MULTISPECIES: protein-glutamate methylesterase/protein-glutamine glutaminase [unclassified Colwellia]|uniref:protein-glutamate methylesterase/protein-glutamine glutaminase n=1 Tax=unclassified Colwellia TaxID=196834 RepID=UPI0015F5C4AB|nr:MULTISPECIES: chemotaxis response regulator protein-glutamate methylesterase [unclassified Colwellia]MBA6233438.1 chemotaxis response regulator protein-glutamate methylesterase [Colwellia sp. MB02u-7]MBA6236528.1 chemotaxis response regulator protein-glutamate methylesterase [Colwellia sp. MB02u-11]MBA6257062.1 chemotaxis response regulator protein-glutamate methylesterase [Colwellia sp. MB3u-28]MBA6260933.1 chemotaxis response regulator protein-glutamate methylesterase [Colwellia sp. MB3u-4
MPYKVLVVDDSSFFRRRVTDILNKDPNLTVIDVAVNGIDAVEKAVSLRPDVITMDIEMPLLNGIEAVKQIMAKAPTSILMFSSLTHQGANATLEALDAGALDFLPKKFSEIAKTSDDAGSLLRQRVVELAKMNGSLKRKLAIKAQPSRVTLSSSVDKPISKFEIQPRNTLRTTKVEPTHSEKIRNQTVKRSSGKKYQLLAIGTSTGGPIALQKILTQLPQNFPLPIILIQHMPAAFTFAFANRLNTLCSINVKEAEDGDILKPGCAYLAPGGRQMIIDGTATLAKLKIIDDNSEKIAFKPSVDISFGSAAKVFSGSVLGVILTGMGSDGREGARMLKGKGATIWAQDEASCVVYGMPQAVKVAGISVLSLALEDISQSIIKEVDHG